MTTPRKSALDLVETEIDYEVPSVDLDATACGLPEHRALEKFSRNSELSG
ncbi:hypothetical protein Q9K02_01780 [Qipengyuania sp. G39]|uniref:Uncharacterized protein n=1 Tax=Qipengyuania profundimaris TaxID=3067652 RepID=A0ABT9HL44_9SPHN|nr:hypothetical protein [Qipengyuania sp. G39]MDP4573867.1 hypothetical protein [Qipengyuania sp. G39]